LLIFIDRGAPVISTRYLQLAAAGCIVKIELGYAQHETTTGRANHRIEDADRGAKNKEPDDIAAAGLPRSRYSTLLAPNKGRAEVGFEIIPDFVHPWRAPAHRLPTSSVSRRRRTGSRSPISSLATTTKAA
jgi:hypothetical protein